MQLSEVSNGSCWQKIKRLQKYGNSIQRKLQTGEKLSPESSSQNNEPGSGLRLKGAWEGITTTATTNNFLAELTKVAGDGSKEHLFKLIREMDRSSKTCQSIWAAITVLTGRRQMQRASELLTCASKIPAKDYVEKVWDEIWWTTEIQFGFRKQGGSRGAMLIIQIGTKRDLEIKKESQLGLTDLEKSLWHLGLE